MTVTGNTILLKNKITDESFQEDIPERYDLYIFADTQKLSCAAVERSTKKFVVLESWDIFEAENSDENYFNDIRLESKLLSLSGYPRVICCTGYKNGTLVPNPLFDAGNAMDQLNFNSNVESTGHLMIDRLQHLEACNIFTVPDLIYQKISSWFPVVEFHHTSTSLIEFLLTVNKNLGEELMTVNVQNSFIETIVTRGRHLLLYNHFKYDSPEELVYLILFVFEQLHLNPDHIKVQFAGEINESDPAYQISNKYIRHIAFVERPESYNYSTEFNILPDHVHFNLFTQVICAS